MISIRRVVVPMSPTEERHWKTRKAFSWVIIVCMVLAIVGLGWSLQAAQNRYIAQQARANLWHAVVSHMPTALVVTNGEDEIIAWNRGAARLFGWQEHEVIGSTTEFLVPSAAVREPYREYLGEKRAEKPYEITSIAFTVNANSKAGTPVRVRGRIGKSTNSHECFIWLFWPDLPTKKRHATKTGCATPTEPQPWPRQVQYRAQEMHIRQLGVE